MKSPKGVGLFAHCVPSLLYEGRLRPLPANSDACAYSYLRRRLYISIYLYRYIDTYRERCSARHRSRSLGITAEKPQSTIPNPKRAMVLLAG